MEMKSLVVSVLLVCATTLPGTSAHAQERAPDRPGATGETRPMPGQLLKALVGTWEGRCRTWVQPGKLADESTVRGTFSLLLDGRFLRHAYTGSIDGRARKGEELIAFNSVTKRIEVAWIDDFHMNYGIMFSEGEPTANGYVVRGRYDVAPDAPAWGWKTVLALRDKDHLTLTAYNVTPDGQEAKAVETEYLRVAP